MHTAHTFQTCGARPYPNSTVLLATLPVCNGWPVGFQANSPANGARAVCRLPCPPMGTLVDLHPLLVDERRTHVTCQPALWYQARGAARGRTLCMADAAVRREPEPGGWVTSGSAEPET